MLEGLTKENHNTIGFVIDALLSGAISKEELRAWATTVIKDNDISDIPDYMFELVDFDASAFHLYEVIGFICDWNDSASQSKALYGIALKRGVVLGEECSPESALKALRKHPEIEQHFRKIFPFINF